MDAILYRSKTGFTKRYALLLGEAAGLPVFSLDEAAGKVKKGAAVIFLGWLMAGSVKGWKKASRRYDVRALCAVGMGRPSEQTALETRKRCGIGDRPLFVLQGGFDMDKLTGIDRFMMKIMEKAIAKGLQNKPDKTEEEREMLEMVQRGGDKVSMENLRPVISWYRGPDQQP